MTIREVKESPDDQGKNEAIARRFDFTNWGTPSAPTVTLLDDFGNDITSTNISGAASVATNYVTTGLVSGLKAGFRYWLFCRATVGGNTMEQWLEIHCTE